MLKRLSTDLQRDLPLVSLRFELDRPLIRDLPAIQSWFVHAEVEHFDPGDEDADPRVEVVARMHIVKGSLLHQGLWQQLDAMEGDLEAVASAVLNPTEGDLNDVVEELMQGALGSSLVIVNSVVLGERWRGFGVGAYLAGEALAVLTSDAHCVALYPAPLDGSQGVVRERAVRKLERVWAQLGFESLTNGVWLLDPGMVYLEEAVERMRANFGLE